MLAHHQVNAAAAQLEGAYLQFDFAFPNSTVSFFSQEQAYMPGPGLLDLGRNLGFFLSVCGFLRFLRAEVLRKMMR